MDHRSEAAGLGSQLSQTPVSDEIAHVDFLWTV
jgi:hypothetical protein